MKYCKCSAPLLAHTPDGRYFCTHCGLWVKKVNTNFLPPIDELLVLKGYNEYVQNGAVIMYERIKKYFESGE